MVTGQQMIGLMILCTFIGVFIGMFSWYRFGIPRCEHRWEKIIDDKSCAGPGHIVVHMCSKCGKRVTTKTNV
jgi:hypothetical protein